ncbi:MAG: NAD(P)/FAD-dependent oxidoreductase [Chloroflexi bacterium]|nr:NAD(P)/FAD-dependent oxidoreductase [Chloroflexota bacterium]
MKVGIIGGGVLGLSLSYFLSRQGITSIVFEGKDRPGGLLDYLQVDGHWIDKYYHCILSSDTDLLALVDAIGLTDRVCFRETKQGFYTRGHLYPMANARDFLLFPPLSPIERFRLGWTILAALRENDWRRLEEVSVEDWLVRLGGRGTFEKLWKPLLNAKFDGSFQDIPATYIWSRLKRTSSTRAAAGQKERMGYFIGSYKVLVDRLTAEIARLGSEVRTGARVRQITIRHGRASGVELDGELVPLDAVIVTTPLPVLAHLIPDPHRELLDLPPTSAYLGVICGLLLLDRPLTPFYTLNIADEGIPLTGLIETTTLIAPEHVGGYHLVYLPKYVTPTNPFTHLDDTALRTLYLSALQQMFPDFREDWVQHLFIFRERFVEPLHLLGKPRPTVPVRSAIPGLYVINNGQIYPELTNCQASVRHALRTLPIVLEDIGAAAADTAVSTRR